MGLFSRKKNSREVNPICTAIIAAAGSSSRMANPGADNNPRGASNHADKLFLMLGDMPVLAYTLSAFEHSDCISNIIVVTRSEKIAMVNDICRDYGITKIKDIIKGGETRAHSVYIGVTAAEGSDYVAIHDGARPFVCEDVIREAFSAAVAHGAAAPGVPVKDTVKIVSGSVVQSTPDRSSLVAVQTPQIFYTGLIKGALYDAIEKKIPLTDDCSAVEAIGMSVYITRGDYRNFKITTPEDMLAAEAMVIGDDSYML